MSTANEDAQRMQKLALHIPRDTDCPIWSVQVVASSHSGVRRAGETIITHANSQVGAALHALACTNIEIREGEDLTLFVQTVRVTT
ncbi:MAG TPA: hypothetical protein VOA78_02880 [Candidatus Dormibacteraeota bacterium]|nr:hypothetical protein [Candidatus Dormibacteraeota bacterium]